MFSCVLMCSGVSPASLSCLLPSSVCLPLFSLPHPPRAGSCPSPGFCCLFTKNLWKSAHLRRAAACQDTVSPSASRMRSEGGSAGSSSPPFAGLAANVLSAFASMVAAVSSDQSSSSSSDGAKQCEGQCASCGCCCGARVCQLGPSMEVSFILIRFVRPPLESFARYTVHVRFQDLHLWGSRAQGKHGKRSYVAIWFKGRPDVSVRAAYSELCLALYKSIRQCCSIPLPTWGVWRGDMT